MIRGRRALALTKQWHVYADEISITQCLFESHVLDPALFLRYTARMAQVHNLLNCFHVVVILINRVVAQDVHVEAATLLDHSQADSSRADDRDGLSGYFIAKERKVRMPLSPLVVAREMFGGPHSSRQHAHHEERKFGSGFSQDVGSVGEGNLVAIGIGAVDVVEADGILRHDFEMTLAGFENLGIDGIAQRG